MSEATLPQTGQSEMPSAGKSVARYAGYIFWLMFFINFINYADRYVFVALGDVIKRDLGLNFLEFGSLTSAFLIIYTLSAFPLGVAADRLSRKNIVAAGVALWSVATALTAFAGTYITILATRTFVGIGEGSYYPAGTPMLAAWYPPKRRADILARWGTGSLIGLGVGFLIGSAVADSNWHIAFLITGIPGLLLALLIWRTRERAKSEGDPEIAAPTVRTPLMRRARGFLNIPTFRIILTTQALAFFALANLAVYLTVYLGKTYGPSSSFKEGALTEGKVALIPGILLIVGGIAGNLIGGSWANRRSRKDPGARVRVGGLGFLLAVPFVVATLVAPFVLTRIPMYVSADDSTKVTIGVAVFCIFGVFATLFLNIYNGPLSAALLDVLRPADRAAGGGLSLTLSHLLGDSYATILVGGIATLLGERIDLALLITCPLALVAAGVIGIRGSRFYAKDVAAVGSSADAMLGTAPVAGQ